MLTLLVAEWQKHKWTLHFVCISCNKRRSGGEEKLLHLFRFELMVKNGISKVRRFFNEKSSTRSEKFPWLYVAIDCLPSSWYNLKPILCNLRDFIACFSLAAISDAKKLKIWLISEACTWPWAWTWMPNSFRKSFNLMETKHKSDGGQWDVGKENSIGRLLFA